MHHLKRRKKTVSLLVFLVLAGIAAVSAFAYFSAGAGHVTSRDIAAPTTSDQSALVVTQTDSECFAEDANGGNNAVAFNHVVRCKTNITNPASNVMQNNVTISPDTPAYTVDAAHSACPAGSLSVKFGTTAPGVASYNAGSINPGQTIVVQMYLTLNNLGVNQDACLGATFNAKAVAVGG